MNIYNYPEQYASVFAPVVFDIRGMRLDTHLNADVNIVQIGATEPIGTKRFYNSSKAKVNIAPYAESCLQIVPKKSCDLEYRPKRVVAMAVEVNGEVSEYRFVAAGREVLPTEVLLSNLTQRVISMGEVDEFSFIPPRGDVWVEIRTEDAAGRQYTTRLAPFYAEEGVLTCGVNTQTLAQMIAQESNLDTENLSKFHYRVYYADSEAFEVRYTVVKPTDGVRLAWVNRYGMIDSYTFQSVVERQTIVKRQTEKSCDGKVAIPIGKAWEQTTITSGLQPQQIVAGLADVATSPKVWQWNGSGWSECIVTDSAITTHRADEPCAIKLTIRPTTNINTQSL